MNRNEQGFSALMLILALVVAGLIAGIGWYVWQQQDKDQSTDTTSQQQNTNPQTAQPEEKAKANVVKISELGIQLTVSDSLQDLQFISGDTSETNMPAVKAVGFMTTKKLVELDASCTTNKGAPLGTVWKVNGTYTTGENTWVLVKQFPDYYIAYREPGMQCSEDPAFNQLVDDLTADLKKSFTTISEAQN